jgi:RNA polymerase sigma factor (sigma-70 family)
MAPTAGDSIPTRPSLLHRLQTGDDTQSWQEFYHTYGGLIRAFAFKAGLTDDEAEEVVQETAISVARNLPGFTYDPKVCAFKTWLLNLTTWRIKDRLRQRQRTPQARGASAAPGPSAERAPSGEGTSLTSTIDRVPDPVMPEFGAEWDAAYEKTLFERALEVVKDEIDLKQFQIFDLYVLREWPASEVARTLGVSVARVYLTKHRVAKRIQDELRRLERKSNG